MASALILCPEAPYPPSGGGSLRTACLVSYLAGRYSTDVIVFREPGGPDPASTFPPGLVRQVLTVDLPSHARHLPARVARNSFRLLRRIPPLFDRFSGFGARIASLIGGRRYDVSVIEHFWCAPYQEQLAAVSSRTVLDLHNVESLLHGRCARTEPAPQAFAHGVFHKTCTRLERHWLPLFSLLLAASKQDAAVLEGLAVGTPVAVVPNALPATPVPVIQEEHAIAFSGNLEYHPNITAVRFFRDRIWPLVRERWPRVEWRLVGKNPHVVERMIRGDARVRCSGPIPDAVSELAKAQVVVVPLRAGSGTRLKILEAWAAARAVVSTSVGAEGLPACHGENILIADDPARFADLVSELLGSTEHRRRLGWGGRTTFERDFTWATAWNCMENSGI